MQDLYGTYRGFTPTDESAVCLGEIKIVIDADRFVMIVATGVKIEEASVNMSDLREMTDDEIAADFNEGAEFEGVRTIIPPQPSSTRSRHVRTGHRSHRERVRRFRGNPADRARGPRAEARHGEHLRTPGSASSNPSERLRVVMTGAFLHF